MKKLTLNINEDGTYNLDVTGFEGPTTITLTVDEQEVTPNLGKQDTREIISEKDCLSIALSEEIPSAVVWVTKLEELETKYGCRLPIVPNSHYGNMTFKEWVNSFTKG